MARAGQETDFILKVDDIGTFTFAKRSMRDEIAIQVEFAKLIDGAEPTAWLQAVCGWISTFRVLTVRAPEGWDIDAMDPLEDETYGKMRTVFTAMTAKEGSFRRKPKQASEGSGAGESGDNRV